MEAVISLIREYTLVEVLVLIFVIFCGCKELYGAYIWIKDRLNGYYNTRNSQEKKANTIEERIARLEKHDVSQYNKLEDISKSLAEIDSFIHSYQEMQRKQNLASTRAVLNQLYSTAKEKQSLTQAEYETYAEMRDLYLSYKGNHHFAEKVIPEMNAFPIIDGVDNNVEKD